VFKAPARAQASFPLPRFRAPKAPVGFIPKLEIGSPDADVFPAMHGINFEEELDKIIAQDPRYPREAYLFVREALDHTQKILGRANRDDAPRHVSGQQLLDGIRDYALQQFGPMSLMVLNEWGIRRCEDFGDIVFNMVDNALLAKTEQDSREDFKGGYDFSDAFRSPFLPESKKSPKASSPKVTG
jgi:uncharacterized repeat protein (TIGR04138 family)